MTYLRSAVPALVATAIVLALAGCSPQATVLPTVQTEQAGTATLDDEKFVVALRAAQLSYDMAWNSGDFTIKPLTESTTAHGIDSIYDHYFAYTFRDVVPEVYAGPPIWAPVEVAIVAGGAEVTVCLADQDRTITAADDETSYDLTTGRLITWVLIEGDDGLVEIDHSIRTEEECDPSASEVLTFDPQPTAPEKITEGDIRGPANADQVSW